MSNTFLELPQRHICQPSFEPAHHSEKVQNLKVGVWETQDNVFMEF